MNRHSRRTIVQKATVVVFLAAYALIVLMFGVIAHDQFRDGRLLETEPKVVSTILTANPRKGARGARSAIASSTALPAPIGWNSRRTASSIQGRRSP